MIQQLWLLNNSPLDGLAYCFLPLPVKTQLSVHVNAYFELSSNRRDIWRGDDTTGESKIRSEWNLRLIENVLAPLYALLLTKIGLQEKRNSSPRSTPINSIEDQEFRQESVEYIRFSLVMFPYRHGIL